jgi:predicted RNA-binding Zn-ribbon protein involved in translation (DUF1610 family)
MAMTEATAERQFPCPNCGSDLTWSPAEQALACTSCGTRLPHDPPQTTLSKFFDSVTGQGARVDPRPSERAAYRCTGCQAVSYFERGVTVSRCPFCGAAAIAPYDAFPDRFRPESIVPFLTSEAEARAAAQAWIRRIWFAPSKLARLLRTGGFRGAYFPFWSFDAHAVAHWDRAGGVRGIIEMDFDDVLVCADRSVDPALVARLEPFPGRIHRAYDPRYAAGWSVARAQRDYDEAADVAHARMQRDLLATAKPGQPAQERDSMQLRGVEYPRETCRQTLLPVWLFEYAYLSRRYRIAVNGATGKTVGDAPASIGKLALLAIAMLWLAVFVADAETAVRLPGILLDALRSWVPSPAGT